MSSPPQGPPPNEGGNTKLILNADLPADVLNRVCEQIEYRRATGLPIDPDLIPIANTIEDFAFYFERRFLESTGFNGPWPKATRFSPDEKRTFHEFVNRLYPAMP